MIWNSAADFWAMGGYGFYVWGSFGVTALLMALEVGWVRHSASKHWPKWQQNRPLNKA